MLFGLNLLVWFCLHFMGRQSSESRVNLFPLAQEALFFRCKFGRIRMVSCIQRNLGTHNSVVVRCSLLRIVFENP